MHKIKFSKSTKIRSCHYITINRGYHTGYSYEVTDYNYEIMCMINNCYNPISIYDVSKINLY